MDHPAQAASVSPSTPTTPTAFMEANNLLLTERLQVGKQLLVGKTDPPLGPLGQEDPGEVSSCAFLPVIYPNVGLGNKFGIYFSHSKSMGFFLSKKASADNQQSKEKDESESHCMGIKFIHM